MENEPQANPADEKNKPQTEYPQKTQAQLDAEERDNVLRKGIAPKDPKTFAKKLQTRTPQESAQPGDKTLVNENEQKPEGDKDPVPPLKTE